MAWPRKARRRRCRDAPRARLQERLRESKGRHALAIGALTEAVDAGQALEQELEDLALEHEQELGAMQVPPARLRCAPVCTRQQRRPFRKRAVVCARDTRSQVSAPFLRSSDRGACHSCAR